MSTLAWYDLVGLVGTVCVLLAYFLLQAGRLPAHGLAYPLLNIVGAASILVSLLGSFNLSVAVLQVAWIAVSLYGIARSFRRRPPAGKD